MVPSPNETLRPLVARLGRPSPRRPIPSRSDMVKLFLCRHCQQTLLFENTRCERCGHQLGYLPDRAVLSAVEPKGATWIALASPHQHHRFCANWERQGCNWMVSADEGEALCIACRHNRTIPDISDPANHLHWRKIKAANDALSTASSISIFQCPPPRAGMWNRLSSSSSAIRPIHHGDRRL